jgi:hypothetical protein
LLSRHAVAATGTSLWTGVACNRPRQDQNARRGRLPRQITRPLGQVS